MDARCRCGPPSCVRMAPTAAVATRSHLSAIVLFSQGLSPSIGALQGYLAHMQHPLPRGPPHVPRYRATVGSYQGGGSLWAWYPCISSYTAHSLLHAGAGGLDNLSGNLKRISQSRPDSGFDLSHFQCESLTSLAGYRERRRCSGDTYRVIYHQVY